MKSSLFVCVILLFGLAGTARAQDDASLIRFRNHALPVLVRVDASGRVTNMRPSVRLTPRVERLLRTNLQEMIAKPAMLQGRAISSQFVMQLALVREKRDDGKYTVRFEYVSSLPIPGGSWYWVHIDGYRLALAEDDVRGHRHYLRQPGWSRDFVPWTPPPVMPASLPPVPAFQNAAPFGNPRTLSGSPGR